MKRILLILTLAVLMSTVIPWAATLAQSNHTPHENPATAEASYDISLPILLHYGDILDMLVNRKYGDINTLIEQLDIDAADIPEDIQNVMKTYNELLSDLSTKLNNLDTLLDETEEFLNQNEFEETRQKLDDADRLIEEIETLLEDIATANEELTSLLGPLASIVETDAVNESKSKLLEAIEKLKALEAEYLASLEEFKTKSEQEITLSSPDLTIETQETQAWVGDSIIVSGVLTSEEGLALPNREVTILLNKEIVATITTDGNGRYETEIKIPYLNIPNMTVQSSYTPRGGDIGKYASSLSPLVDIEIMFYPTELSLEVPGQVYPGVSYEICGQITYDSGNSSIEREINLYYDDELLSTTHANGSVFEIEFTPDDQTTLGEHTLAVIAEPQGQYNSVAITKTITIVKETPEISIDNLSYSIMSRKVYVKGELVSDLPLQGTTVTIELKGASTTISTSADGKFEATLGLPLDSINIGNQEVTITVEPSEAWHLTTEATIEVFIVDIVNIGLASAAFICIGLVLYTTKRNRLKPKKGEVHFADSLFLPQEPTEIALQKPEKLKGTKARIAKAYTEAMVMIEAATKAPMKPHMTLREFLRKTTPYLKNITDPFTELTHLAENALYSPHMPEADEADRAENLTFTIMEMLRHGSV